LTILLYHTDSYLREMDAIVTRVEGVRVALDRTVFYAQGGGQPADAGTLHWDGGQTRVVDVRKMGEEVLPRWKGRPHQPARPSTACSTGSAATH
jgi:Ser-tRNA(Ala) deacylase AlaX